MKRKWIWLLFGLYSLLMLWLLFGQRLGTAGDRSLNLQPFETIRRFLWVLEHSNSPGIIHHAVVNLAGNVVMFIPLGILLPMLWRSMGRVWAFLPVAVGVILAVEGMQLLTRLGSCDVDDLILNTVGAAIGYCAWRTFRHWGRQA